MAESALIVRLRKTIAKTKDPLKKARLTAQLNKLTKKKEVGTAKSGDVQTARTHYSDFLPDKKLPKSVLEKFAGTLSDYGGKKSKEIDWEEEREKRSHQTAEEMYGLGSAASDPGGFMPYSYGWKHGGSIKKAKKKSKKSRPRGIRIALRGYGKAMGRG